MTKRARRGVYSRDQISSRPLDRLGDVQIVYERVLATNRVDWERSLERVKARSRSSIGTSKWPAALYPNMICLRTQRLQRFGAFVFGGFGDDGRG